MNFDRHEAAFPVDSENRDIASHHDREGVDCRKPFPASGSEIISISNSIAGQNYSLSTASIEIL
ncbi:hypothetical protein [Burkholderia sp. A1]|uniref:hypothetical protein n=1 Tax=Burkholderia sp. A1 TaxID=148446 RepID=UPI001A7EA3B6|nr:hypothetical protein [Burkholderia sp. A1]